MKFDHRHYKAMELMLQGRSNTSIAEELGISRMTLYNWTKKPEWQEEFRNMLRTHSASGLRKVIDSMESAAIEDRNAAAAKLLLQMNQLLEKENTAKNEVKVEINLDKIREAVAAELNGVEIDEDDV